MLPISIMHTADLHLGAPLISLGEDSATRRVEIVRTFYRMLDVCQTEGVEVLLIAGDFLEFSTLKPAMLQDIIAHLQAASSVQIFISPGNHDFWAPDRPYVTATWPNNVHIFDGRLTRVDVGERMSVYGAAFTGTYQQSSLLSGMDWEAERETTADRVRLLLVHGDWGKKESPYHAILPSDVPADFFTYVALGHVHKRSPLETLGRTVVAYSGSPDGGGFDETGVHGVYQGTVTPFHVALDFVPFSSRLFWEGDVDLTGVGSIDDAVLRVLSALQEEQYPPSDLFSRVRLVGEAAEDDPIDLALLQQALSEHVHAITLRDARRAGVDWGVLAEEDSLRGYYARALLKRAEGADETTRALLERALRVGMDAFNGREIDLAD